MGSLTPHSYICKSLFSITFIKHSISLIIVESSCGTVINFISYILFLTKLAVKTLVLYIYSPTISLVIVIF